MLSLVILLPAAIAATTPAVPLERKTVSLALANSLTGAAIASCRKIGRKSVVAVVDRGGNLVSLQRGDDIGPHNTLAAQRKAFTALSTKANTTVLAERAATDPTSRILITIPELLLLGGGMPVVVDGDVIGGIGVAGSGGSANDERCATEAIAQVLGKARTRP
ncbi:GlcG/HbpS family heme-binding protein [Sphingomonas sp. Leaf226]|uniref:GlcG/HbpS family heme-binding protein n=1 Tax=Sphingomonas sp. Leaf226 TaxID=1735691 RepID=UPI000B31E964|nr:heme-binding protein [Sphingomonas sp. Leaf226]